MSDNTITLNRRARRALRKSLLKDYRRQTRPWRRMWRGIMSRQVCDKLMLDASKKGPWVDVKHKPHASSVAALQDRLYLIEDREHLV